MSGSHKVLNKIFRDRCLVVSQIFDRVLNMPRVTQGFEENILSYLFDRFLSIPWALHMLGLEFIRVMNMPHITHDSV